MQMESRKRVFGTDITNVNVKRSKTSEDASERRLKMKKHAVAESSYNKSFDAYESRHGSSRGYQFGPFAPGTGTYPTAAMEENSGRAFDVENLVSGNRPSYQNQGKHIYSYPIRQDFVIKTKSYEITLFLF